MKDRELQEKITLTCPNGHRLRGEASFAGKTVKCPRCHTAFVVSLPERSEVTDTSVMKILGECSSHDAISPQPFDSKAQPCPRCGVGIDEGSTVCPHCKCYVGVLPRYMTDMMPHDGRQIG